MVHRTHLLTVDHHFMTKASSIAEACSYAGCHALQRKGHHGAAPPQHITPYSQPQYILQHVGPQAKLLLLQIPTSCMAAHSEAGSWLGTCALCSYQRQSTLTTAACCTLHLTVQQVACLSTMFSNALSPQWVDTSCLAVHGLWARPTPNKGQRKVQGGVSRGSKTALSLPVVCALQRGVSRKTSPKPLRRMCTGLLATSVKMMRVGSTPLLAASCVIMGSPYGGNRSSHSTLSGTLFRILHLHTPHSQTCQDCTIMLRTSCSGGTRLASHIPSSSSASMRYHH